MIARSRDRGSHAGRTRGSGLPFNVPGLAGRSASAPARLDSQAAPAAPEVPLTPDVPVTPGFPVASPAAPGGFVDRPSEPGPAAVSVTAPNPAYVPSLGDLAPGHPLPGDAGPGDPVRGNPILDNPILDNPILDNPIPGNPAPGDSAPAALLPGSLPLPGELPQPGPAPRPGRSPRPGRTPRPGGASHGPGSRHRKSADKPPPWSGKKFRLAAALVVTLGVLGAGFATGFGREVSAEPTVQAFLLDWQQGHYAQAAALTTGSGDTVAAQLAAAYTDLDASNEFFALGGITQHGNTAVATYRATVDLAQAGQEWTYQGQFRLSSASGHWVIAWTPALINSRLGPGDRLAVVTTFAPRAAVEDMDGQPLLAKSASFRIGVYPGQLKNPTATAAGFSKITGLDEQQVLGQIESAPPNGYLSLLTVDRTDFDFLWGKLAEVPGLSYQQQAMRLFDSSASDVVGAVGTENSQALRDEGAAYQPGTTVGLTGLEQTYQDELVGTPTTSVVVVNPAGRDVATLWSSANGRPGTPVRTTLSSRAQVSAVSALAGQPSSAEIVAVDPATGEIRALATHQAGRVALPAGGALDAKVEPGMAYSIVSAAALLATGVSVKQPLPCESVADVGGDTFTYQPAASASATFATDFADGCGTAFANMSRSLTPQQLTTAERSFGINATWRLQLPAFSGTAATASGEADVAAQAIGTGGVLTSPLGMALVAAEVASGTGHTPVLVSGDSSTSWQAPLSPAELQELRLMMHLAVTSGSAKAANLPGAAVYGQAGVVQTGKHAYLSWFVGYRDNLAVAVVETGTTAAQAAASVAGAFLKTAS